MKKIQVALLALVSLLVVPARADIQFSGVVPVNTTFATDASVTGQEFVNLIETAMLSAGWTTISGSGTATLLMESLATPQGMQMRVEITVSGSNAVFKARNVANTRAQTTGMTLVPANSETWRLIGQKYQIFIFQGSSTTVARKAVAFGVPWVPTTPAFTEAIWACGDNDANITSTFRVSIGCGYVPGFNRENSWVAINGTAYAKVETGNSIAGGLMFSVPFGTNTTNGIAVKSGQTWWDDSYLLSDPLLATGLTTTTIAKIFGQMWDAMIYGSQLTLDTEFVINGKDWWAYTYNNAAPTNINPSGQLLLYVP